MTFNDKSNIKNFNFKISDIDKIDGMFKKFDNYLEIKKNKLGKFTYDSYNSKLATSYGIAKMGLINSDIFLGILNKYKYEIDNGIYRINSQIATLYCKNEEKSNDILKSLDEFSKKLEEFNYLFKKYKSQLSKEEKEYFREKVSEYASKITNKNNMVFELECLIKNLKYHIDSTDVYPITRKEAEKKIKKYYKQELANIYIDSIDILKANRYYLGTSYDEIAKNFNRLYNEASNNPFKLQNLKNYTLKVIKIANLGRLKYDDKKYELMYKDKLKSIYVNITKLLVLEKMDAYKSYTEKIEKFVNLIYSYKEKLTNNLENNLINYYVAYIQLESMSLSLFTFKNNILKEKEGFLTDNVNFCNYLYYKNSNNYSMEKIDENGKIIYLDKHNDVYHTHKYIELDTIKVGSTTSAFHNSNNKYSLCRIGTYKEYMGLVMPPKDKDLNYNGSQMIVWYQSFGKCYKDGNFVGYVYYDIDTNKIEKLNSFNFELDDIDKTSRLI